MKSHTAKGLSRGFFKFEINTQQEIVRENEKQLSNKLTKKLKDINSYDAKIRELEQQMQGTTKELK